ncbi:MAG: aldehyde dehydrogenase family protein [Dehalococcoidia bacterium]|nr:aldehyde dehydrogenase family protein [Dehalococcoidia bacterium]
MEPEIEALGRRLLAAAEKRDPLTLTPEWWQERLLDWATSDPDFRVKLLRFVDVLPTLRSARAVADHIRQYFRGDVPAIVHVGSELAAAPVFRPVVSQIVRQSVYAMAHRFIAGETPAEAVERLRELARDGVAYTVDLLGEATLSEEEAGVYLKRYTELIEVLAREAPGPAGGVWQDVPPVNISIKLSALYSQFEAAAPESVSEGVRARLRPLLRLARERHAFVNVDMEQYRFKDLVHHAFADVLREPEFAAFSDIGIVVQAYLKDAESDIARLRALAEERGAPFSVRLVKGAYWEEERIVASQNDWAVPVFEDKAATDASFERCTDALIDAWPHLRPAFGTHNPRSIAQAAVKARAAGLADADIEFQMLFGMADELRDAVAEEGYRTRVYAPVGAVIPGMAYLVRRLLENTSNQSWFIQEERASPEELLAAPQPADAPDTSSLRPYDFAESPPFHNAPPAEFHHDSERKTMRAALDRVRRDFGKTQPLLIGEERVSRRELAEVRYPADPSLLPGRVAQGTRADVDAAVKLAHEAFPAWRDRPVAERAAILRRAADLVGKQRYDLAALMVYESGKPWREADGDVIEAADYLRYYALQAERLLQPVAMDEVLGEDNVYLREARGVAAIIAPWNFPLAIICGMSSAALAAGNCVILKPAAQSPLIAARLAETLREAGVPDEVVQYLPGPGGEVGQALVEHPGVETIAFTGSKEVGLGILRAAAEVRPGQRSLKRVIAEMGGKNAIIVDDDADLDQAVAGAITSAFGYAGQKCSACSRLIIVGSAYDETLARLAPAVESLVAGQPHQPASYVPPVISEAAQKRIEGYIETGKKTARLLVQGSRPEGDGYFVAPTVFVDVARDDRLARDEIFGPVLSVFRARDFDEGLEIALDSEFALTGGVYSRNPRNIERARREFRVGNLYINRKTTGAIVGRHPFGGLRMSGVGDKAGGPDYLLQFLEPRTISENTTRRGFAPEGIPFDATRSL